jgi:hypothetical protein
MSLLLTLAVCVTWAALTVGFCGIGVLWLRRLTGLQPSWQNAYLAVWAGFGLLMTGLLVWHFFLPVNALALWLFALLATAALMLEWRWFRATLSKDVSAGLVLAIGAFALWAANHALAKGLMDDFNYEFQAIRWFHDYRIVPGLANLHGRIGFNNSHHLFGALLSSGPWSGSVNHVFNGLFIVLVFALLAAAVRELALGRTSSSILLCALFVSPCVGLVLFSRHGPIISTLKADLFVCAATVTVAVLFVEFAETPAREDRRLPIAATILLLSAVLYSVKISAVVFSGIIAVAVLIRLLATVGWRHRVTVFSTLIAGLIVCSVLLRGVILSGYPLYPSTRLGMRVDWRVPVAQANAEWAYITSWAQLKPTYDPAAVHGWAWIPYWAQSTVVSDKFGIVLPLTLAFLCLLLLMFRSGGAQRIGVPRWALATLATASVISLFVWFVQAPAGRFAFVYFWILFAVAFTIAMQRSKEISRLALAASAGIVLFIATYLIFFVLGVPPEFRSSMALMLVFGPLWIAASSWAIANKRYRLLAALCLALGFYQSGDRALAHVLRRRFEELGRMVWLNVTIIPERLEKFPYVTRQTRQGMTVYEAIATGYDTPLPNTHYFNPALELRVPGDLSGGFRNPNQGSMRYGYSVRVVDPHCCELITPE